MGIVTPMENLLMSKSRPECGRIGNGWAEERRSRYANEGILGKASKPITNL